MLITDGTAIGRAQSGCPKELLLSLEFRAPSLRSPISEVTITTANLYVGSGLLYYIVPVGAAQYAGGTAHGSVCALGLALILNLLLASQPAHRRLAPCSVRSCLSVEDLEGIVESSL